MSASLLARSSPRAGRLAQLAGQAVRWWLGELSGLVPQRALALAGRRGTAASLEFAPGETTLVIPGIGRAGPIVIPIDAEPYAGPAGTGTSGQPTLDIARARIRRQVRHAVVPIRLADKLVYRRTIELPLAAERSLEGILQHQLDRLTPLDPAAVRFAWRLVERVPARNVLRLEVAITRLATLERARALATALGLVAGTIESGRTESGGGGETTGFNHVFTFWRSTATAHSTPRTRRLRHGLELAAAVLAGGAYLAHVQNLDEARTRLQDQIATAARRADAVRAVDASARSAEHALAFFAGRGAAPTPLAVIDELTRVIPPDSWVSELRLHEGKAELVGITPRATDLIGRIAGSPLFADVTFGSPTILAGNGTGERFDITLAVRAEAVRAQAVRADHPAP